MDRIPFPLLPAWLRWGLVVLLAGFVFYVSVIVAPPETAIDTRPDIIPLDKWRHFLAYAAIGGALAYATADWERERWVLAVGVIGITVVYGVGIEFAQSVLPNRYFSVGDAYANALGGLLVVPWYGVERYLDLTPLGTLYARYRGNIDG